jgi:hypothetical protein
MPPKYQYSTGFVVPTATVKPICLYDCKIVELACVVLVNGPYLVSVGFGAEINKLSLNVIDIVY